MLRLPLRPFDRLRAQGTLSTNGVGCLRFFSVRPEPFDKLRTGYTAVGSGVEGQRLTHHFDVYAALPLYESVAARVLYCVEDPCLLLAGESFPCRLTADVQSLANLGPGHTVPAELINMLFQGLLHSFDGGCRRAQHVKHILVA